MLVKAWSRHNLDNDKIMMMMTLLNSRLVNDLFQNYSKKVKILRNHSHKHISYFKVLFCNQTLYQFHFLVGLSFFQIFFKL